MLCYLVSMMTSTELFRLGVPMSYASTVTRLFPCTYNINIMSTILIVILITIIIYINIIILTNTITVIHENYHNYSDHHKYYNYISPIHYQTCQNLTYRIEHRIFLKYFLICLDKKWFTPPFGAAHSYIADSKKVALGIEN